MSEIETQFEAIASQYAAHETDKVLSRYELEINWPSIRHLLPSPPAKVLDYGCGSGLYSQLLTEAGYTVVATDNSQAMLKMIKNPKIKTYLWSYHDESIPEVFDVIIAKLVVQFVENLQSFSIAMREQLRPKGNLIISIPHPDKSKKISQDQGSDREYVDEVSKSGLKVKMIHRSFAEYKRVFESMGFRLAGTHEPRDSHKPAALPRRLNMCFEVVE